MPSNVVVHRWEALGLERVTEMISRKVVAADQQMVAQVYLKRGAHVPVHQHDSEQLTYVLQGALRIVVDSETVVVRQGEIVHIPAGASHQAEALDDTFELELFSPVRADWLPSRTENVT